MPGITPYYWRDHGVPMVIYGPEPDVKPGNAQFFDPHPDCLIQVRPLLKCDYGPLHAGRKGNALLYARTDEGVDFACYVRLTGHQRKNNRAGIMAAIERVERFDPELGARLRTIAARTRWPAPDTWSWKT